MQLDNQSHALVELAFTKTECRYAQIEKESPSIVFELEKFHQYTYVRPMNVETDH